MSSDLVVDHEDFSKVNENNFNAFKISKKPKKNLFMFDNTEYCRQ